MISGSGQFVGNAPVKPYMYEYPFGRVTGAKGCLGRYEGPLDGGQVIEPFETGVDQKAL
jgi:hypothetical protein